MPTLRAELLERIKEPTPTNLTAEAMQVGTLRVGLLSWRRLLDALKEAVKDEHHTASDVQRLDGLVGIVYAGSVRRCDATYEARSGRVE